LVFTVGLFHSLLLTGLAGAINGTWLRGFSVLFLVVDFTKNVPWGGQVLEWFWPSFDGPGFLPKRPDIEDLGGAGGDDFLAQTGPSSDAVRPAHGIAGALC